MQPAHHRTEDSAPRPAGATPPPEHLATLRTSYVIMDELETFIHARFRQVSVGMAVRVKTGEVLSFGVARKPHTSTPGSLVWWGDLAVLMM
jgi:hypothetical protein